MKNNILVAAALLLCLYLPLSCSDTNQNASEKDMNGAMNHTEKHDAATTDNMEMDHGMMQSMKKMSDEMNAMKMTGDFDLDFANMMIIHHQAAIDMSEVEIANGSDAQVKAMAEKISTAQKSEIEQMQQFVKKHKMSATQMQNNEMHNKLSESMKTMMESMGNMTMTGNTDKDFVMMMIPHHEGAVTMAEDELAQGKHLEMKKMAQKMIVDQNKEINEFNSWISSNK